MLIFFWFGLYCSILFFVVFFSFGFEFFLNIFFFLIYGVGKRINDNWRRFCEGCVRINFFLINDFVLGRFFVFVCVWGSGFYIVCVSYIG